MFRLLKEIRDFFRFKKEYRNFNVNIDSLDKAMYMKFERFEYHTNHLTIYHLNSIFKDKQTIKRIINFRDIKSIEYISELKTSIKDKSFIGRAVVGGLLLGGTGAILGGLSSCSTSYDNKRYYFIVIELNNGEKITIQDCQGATIDYGFFKRLYEKYSTYKEKQDHANAEINYLINKEIHN